MRGRTWAGTLVLVALGAGAMAAPAAGDEIDDYAAIRGDFQTDRAITACRFTVEQLENARGMMTGEDEYSGLQGALESEIVRQRTGGCPGGGGEEGAPVVSRVRFVPRSVRPGRGTTLRFGLSRRARVTVVLERRRGRRWTRVSTLVRPDRRAGENAISLRTRRSAFGAYRARVSAIASGRRSATRTATLTVRR